MFAPKLFAFLSLIALTSAVIQTRLVELRVDHFNPIDRRTFDGRYFVNSELWIPGGPLFIYVGGGFDLHGEFLTQGLLKLKIFSAFSCNEKFFHTRRCL